MKLLSTFPGKTHSLSFTFQLKTLFYFPFPNSFFWKLKIYFSAKLLRMPNPK